MKKTFLLTNNSIEVVLKISYQCLSIIKVVLVELRKYILRSYIIAGILPTTSWVKLIDKKEFTKIAMNKTSKIFVIYIAGLEATKLVKTFIHPFEAVLIALLLKNKSSLRRPAQGTNLQIFFPFI